MIQSIVMRDERPGRGAPGDGLHRGRLDLDKTPPAMMLRNAAMIFDRPRKVWSDSGLVNRST